MGTGLSSGRRKSVFRLGQVRSCAWSSAGSCRHRLRLSWKRPGVGTEKGRPPPPRDPDPSRCSAFQFHEPRLGLLTFAAKEVLIHPPLVTEYLKRLPWAWSPPCVKGRSRCLFQSLRGRYLGRHSHPRHRNKAKPGAGQVWAVLLEITYTFFKDFCSVCQ